MSSTINGFCSAEDDLKPLREKEKAWKYHKVKGTEVGEKRKSWTARSSAMKKRLRLTRSNNMRRRASDSLRILFFRRQHVLEERRQDSSEYKLKTSYPFIVPIDHHLIGAPIHSLSPDPAAIFSSQLSYYCRLVLI